MSDKLKKESEVTIEVSKEYAKAMGIMADLYGLSTSDFLSKALNGELDNMKMKRLPTPVEMFRVHRALKKDSKDLRKTIMESGADYEGLKLWMIWISNEKGHLRNQVSFFTIYFI